MCEIKAKLWLPALATHSSPFSTPGLRKWYTSGETASLSLCLRIRMEHKRSALQPLLCRCKSVDGEDYTTLFVLVFVAQKQQLGMRRKQITGLEWGSEAGKLWIWLSDVAHSCDWKPGDMADVCLIAAWCPHRPTGWNMNTKYMECIYSISRRAGSYLLHFLLFCKCVLCICAARPKRWEREASRQPAECGPKCGRVVLG